MKNPVNTQAPQHPLNGVTLVKCATPKCQNGVRASREVYCSDCLAKQASADPEAN